MHFTKIRDGLFQTWHKGVKVIISYNKKTGIRSYEFHFPGRKIVRETFDMDVFNKYQVCAFAEPVKAYRPKASNMWPRQDSKRAVFKNPSGYKKPVFRKH